MDLKISQWRKKEDPCLKIPKNKMEREKNQCKKKNPFWRETPKSSESQVLISKASHGSLRDTNPVAPY